MTSVIAKSPEEATLMKLLTVKNAILIGLSTARIKKCKPPGHIAE